MTTQQPKPVLKGEAKTEVIEIQSSQTAERNKAMLIFVLASFAIVMMMAYQAFVNGWDYVVVALLGLLVIGVVAWTVWTSY